MTDKAVRARVAGRQTVAEKILWQLNVGDFRVRCIPHTVEAGAYIVEARIDGVWRAHLCFGKDPVELLQRVAKTSATTQAIREMLT